jgi:hypothetical protein
MNLPIRIRNPGIKKHVYIEKWLSFQTSSFPSGPDAEVSLQHLECRLVVVLFGPQKPDEECIAYITVEVLLPLYQVPANKYTSMSAGLRIRIRTDTQHFGKTDPDRH